jgi:hypothetical protein
MPAIVTRLIRRAAYGAAVIAVTVAAQSCSQLPKPDPEDPRFQESLAEQKRINRYFHDAVVPRLNTCWPKVQGTGTVEIGYTFEKNAQGDWGFRTLEVAKSSLPEGQDVVAANCMEQAVGGTSFPAEQRDEGETYLIRWDWPVPLPGDIKEQADRMFKDNGGGGTGCDGKGTAAKCFTCKGATQCLTVCVGYQTCDLISTSKETSCTSTKKCASGGPFGVIGGGAILY